MSECPEVKKGTAQKKKVKGWSTEEMKDKANSLFGSRLRRNEKMERHESGSDGSILEEFGRQH